MANLGVVLTPFGQIPGAPPWEVGYSYGGDGTYLCPDDPYFNTRGEPGMYYDTQLGRVRKIGFWDKLKMRLGLRGSSAGYNIAKNRGRLAGLGHSIPTDFDFQPTYGFVPFMDGFVDAKEGFQPGTWIPPDGWNPAGAYGPQMVPRGLSGFGDAVQSADLQTLVTTLENRNTKLFYLSLISTTAIVVSSIIAAVRNAKLIQQEKRILEEEAHFTG